MTIQEAKSLIVNAQIDSSHAQTWLDLGCGSGTFTLALAELLPPGSEVVGIDKSYQDIAKQHSNGVTVSFRQGDMNEHFEIDIKVDGILMANSLHYIKEKHTFFKDLLLHLKGNGTLLFVEYDMEESNPWVPYPISFSNLRALFASMDIANVQIKKIGERPSVYGDKKMYACEVRAHLV